MNDIIYFDISAILVLMFLLFSAFFRRQTKSRIDKILIILMIDTMLCGILDIVSVSYKFFPELITFHDGMVYKVAQYGYLITQNSIPSIYVFFIISYTDSWHNWKTNKILRYFIFIPAVVLCVLFATNSMTGKLFYFDEAGHYIRGDWFAVVYIYSFSTVFVMLYQMIKYKKLFDRVKFVTLNLIWVVIVVASIVQMIFSHFLITVFSVAIAILLITITVNRVELYVDNITGLNGKLAYVENMHRVYINKKPVQIIIINVGNVSNLRSAFDYEEQDRLIKAMSMQLNISKFIKNSNYDVYYIDNGMFRIVIEKNKYEKVLAVAEKLWARLSEGIVINGKEVHPEIHIGLARIPYDAESYEKLVMVERNLNASDVNRAGVILAKDLVDTDRFKLISNLDEIIRNALDYGRLQVYYQPIYSVSKKKFTSAEALIRLIDPEYGFVPPDLFISRAEMNGMINEIGQFVLEEVCKFIASDEYKELGIEYVEINLSVAQCMHPTLAREIEYTLKKYNVKPEQVNLEITETSANEQPRVFMQNLTKLNEAGISFSLDDYGTGYSNIERITMMPLKIVKLDRIMVREVYDDKLWAIVSNTIRMLKDIELEIVVEGVETKKELETFESLGCDYIQGYYFSKPLPKDEFTQFIKDNL